MSDEIKRDESIDVQSMMEERQNELKHGDYVPGENGEAGGIVIDHDAELQQATQPPIYESALEYVKNQQDQINAMKSGSTTESVDAEAHPMTDADIEAMNIRKAGAMDREAMLAVEKAFSQYDISSKGGLVPAGTEKKEAMPTHVNPNQDVVDGDGVMADSEQPQVVQFNVPKENTPQFISTLDITDREKITHSNEIVINEIETLDIPVARRMINSLDEYRRVAPRSIVGNIRECVLPNSGYVATVTGVGSMAMASLLPDTMGNPRDVNKRYQLCYDALVNTSIGKLTYQEFTTQTSADDIDLLLYSILRASDPDDNSIIIECGACKRNHEIKYKLSELMDVDKLSEEMVARINEIVDAKEIVEKAKEIHNNSPAMKSKYIQITSKDPDNPNQTQEIIVELKHPDGQIFIDRASALAEINESFSQYVAGIVFYVPRIYRKFTLQGETEPRVYEIRDPFAIAETIGEIDDKSLRVILKAVESMDKYDNPTFSFKGEFRCPECGRVETEVPCQIDSLIFYKVGMAMGARS